MFGSFKLLASIELYTTTTFLTIGATAMVLVFVSFGRFGEKDNSAINNFNIIITCWYSYLWVKFKSGMTNL
jgi:hypothetical protein